MRSTLGVLLVAYLIVVTAWVYAGDGFSMKCDRQECGYESLVIFGGGMKFEQASGYCQHCRDFVYLRWTRKESPLVAPDAKFLPPPKSIGEVWDSRSGNSLTLYPCPRCRKPFAEIKDQEDLKHCPVCKEGTFKVDGTKPRLDID